jgi:hypothetical protein
MTVHDHHRRLPVVIPRDKKATIGSLKRFTVLQGLSKLVSNFKEERKNFDLDFQTTRHKKFENFL